MTTLNINGITAPKRVGMLSDFIKRHEIDILFHQEVTNPDVLNFRGYETHHNIGTSLRGTAIIAREAIPITIAHKLPSGRTMSAEYNGIRLINLYVLSGSARRTERKKNFYNTQLPAFLYTDPSHMILEEILIVY
jgi:exonuclease III